MDWQQGLTAKCRVRKNVFRRGGRSAGLRLPDACYVGEIEAVLTVMSREGRFRRKAFVGLGLGWFLAVRKGK